jgi:hypothetical protein
VTLDEVQTARAQTANAYRRLADAALAAAVALDDSGTLPDELDTTMRRVRTRHESAKHAHDTHMATRTGYARSHTG